jgi:hypothetical protein
MQKYFRREVLISAAFICVSILIFAGFFYWFAKDFDSRGNKILVDRGLISKKAEALAILAELKRDAPVAASYQKSIDLTLATQDQLILDFRQWLEGLARAHSLDITFQFQGNEVPPQEDALGYAVFRMSVGGALKNVISFTKDVEGRASRFLVSIDGFDLRESSGGYTVSIQGKVFFR